MKNVGTFILVAFLAWVAALAYGANDGETNIAEAMIGGDSTAAEFAGSDQ